MKLIGNIYQSGDMLLFSYDCTNEQGRKCTHRDVAVDMVKNGKYTLEQFAKYLGMKNSSKKNKDVLANDINIAIHVDYANNKIYKLDN